VCIQLDLVGTRDADSLFRDGTDGKTERESWILTFDNLLSSTSFTEIMARMLKTLEEKHRNPVDIEFTVNFNRANDIQVNLLQCRPFHTLGTGRGIKAPEYISKEKIIISIESNFMGGNISRDIQCIIFVDPKEYADLTLSEKYSVARLIGKLNRTIIDQDKMPTLLLGPGRWGTRTPAMGVPVTFSEINQIVAMAEISYQDGNLIPDLSFGTHFFHDLVETKIFYFAVYPENPEVIFNLEWLRNLPNQLRDVLPDNVRYENVIKVVDLKGKGLMLTSNVVTQKMICYLS